MLLNLGMAHKQLEQLGHVTAAMVLVNAFQVCFEVAWGPFSLPVSESPTSEHVE